MLVDIIKEEKLRKDALAIMQAKGPRTTPGLGRQRAPPGRPPGSGRDLPRQQYQAHYSDLGCPDTPGGPPCHPERRVGL